MAALTALGATGPVVYNRAAADSVFEAYVFTLTLDALDAAGYSVDLRSIRSQTTAPVPFVVRGSPGFVHSRIADYGYAHVQTPAGDEYELHIDVQCVGNSGSPTRSTSPSSRPGMRRTAALGSGFRTPRGCTVQSNASTTPGLPVSRWRGPTPASWPTWGASSSAFCCNLPSQRIEDYLNRKSRAYPALALTPLSASAEAAYRNAVMKAKL